MVLSTEKNPVVAARCKKLKLPVISGAAEKPPLLMQYLKDNQIDPQK
jgi:3-deoxy-D-manno-octulosonate 8-phosphate phosphatase KdsC-like HAD superfamily phosphatase